MNKLRRKSRRESEIGKNYDNHSEKRKKTNLELKKFNLSFKNNTKLGSREEVAGFYHVFSLYLFAYF